MENKAKIQRKHLIIMGLALVIIVVGTYFKLRDPKTEEPALLVEEYTQDVKVPIEITEKKIEEDNFTGTKPLITGSGAIVTEANKYIEKTISDFKKSADDEVPAMRKDFGADSPMANYSIEMKAKTLKSDISESILLEMYIYTGGANGNSSYKTFTSFNANGKIVSIKELIKKNSQADFMAYLRNKLITWRPDKSTDIVVFEDEVKSLTIDNITNWAISDGNLVIYFDKYAIGPGVLGGVAFPLPLTSVQKFFIDPQTLAPAPKTKEKITYNNASTDLISVELPFPGAVTGKEFSVIGKARGQWFFEASFPIELRDANGKLLFTAIAQADGDWMTTDFVPFKAEVKAPMSYIGPATLILIKDNASGLPEHDASISFPIKVEY